MTLCIARLTFCILSRVYWNPTRDARSFQFKGKVWVLLHLYPVLERDEFGLPITTVPSGFRPVDRLVLLDSKKTKLSNAVPLWLSYKVVREKTVVYRFVPL